MPRQYIRRTIEERIEFHESKRNKYQLRVDRLLEKIGLENMHLSHLQNQIV